MENLYNFDELELNKISLPVGLCKEINIAEDYKCFICSNLPINPKTIGEIEALICTKCIDQYNNGEDTPNAGDLKEPGEITKRTLNKLTIRCPHDSCKVEESYLNIILHIKECKHTPRVALCTCCNEKFDTTNEANEIKEHLTRCAFYPEVCSHCQGVYLRKDLNDHVEVCDYREHECQFCGLKYTNPNFDSHRRIVCVQTLFTKYKDEVRSLSNKIDDLHHELNSVKGKRSSDIR
jgi:hypothetical protein